jgi:pimeloyl-ACP methyl ester carboxylesterase
MHIPGFESKTSLIKDVRTHYWVGGDLDGVPVLLWHGFLGTAYSWRRVMTQLAEAGYAVLAPDMRGYGDSDKPPGTGGYDGVRLRRSFAHWFIKLGLGRRGR